jgi:hypothetical protein
MRKRMSGTAGERADDRPDGDGQVQPDDLPRSDRRSVDIRGFARIGDDTRIPVVVVNLSYDGCRIETPVPFDPGTSLRLSTRLGELDAEVSWCSGTEAGLLFKGHSSEPLQEPAARLQRQSQRLPVVLKAKMKRFGRSGYEVPVSDIATRGCKVEFTDRPDIGESVSLRFDGLDSLEATVRWITDRSCGLDFARPLHPAILDMLLQPSSRPA